MLEKGNAYYEILESFIQNLDNKLKINFPDVFIKKTKHLKESILKASAQYIFDENKSLWSETWFKDAYIAYFTLTQASRLHYAFSRAEGFINFKDVNNVVDFGCGSGAAHVAANAVFANQLKSIKWINIDSAKEALDCSKKIETSHNLKSTHILSKTIPEPRSQNDLLILSFSICEGLDLENLFKYKYILILEPGQIEHSKNLIYLREQALEKGLTALAPCPHQLKCPMSSGPKNWCHDTAPKPKSIPLYGLPFSDLKLNFSYLLLNLADQTKPFNAPLPAHSSNSSLARAIGDLRLEKGKSKIAICKNEEPVFLSWLKKSKLEVSINRGDLIELPKTHKTKGQEVRIVENIIQKDPRLLQI